MSDSDSALSFIRQRRDLFVISALLIIAQIAHFRVNESLSLFGASISVGKPEIFIYVLWVLWAYWLVRYLQIFLREKSVDKIKSAIFIRIKTLLAKRTAILFQRDPSGNGFKEEKDLFWGGGGFYDEYGLQVGAPLREYEGTKIRVHQNGVVYDYTVPLDEYIGCVILKLPEFILLDTEFTDYIFPFLFAFIPLIILLS